MDASASVNKERLLVRIRELAPGALSDGLEVKLHLQGGLLLSGRVDIREATWMNIALHLFQQEVPGVPIIRKNLEFFIPTVRLGKVTNQFERVVLSEFTAGKKGERYLDGSKLVHLPEWNTDFVIASDNRYGLRHLQPRYPASDTTATIESVARFVADFCPGIVVHTGAGFSSNAGLATYREGSRKSVPIEAAMPTYAHYALVKLVQTGKVDFVCSQNVDGLHRRSGLDADCLSELHGNSYIETCNCCSPSREFLRPFCVDTEKDRHARHGEANIALSENECRSGINHVTGRVCRHGGGPLRDSIIHFEEGLSVAAVQAAKQRSKAAPLNLVLGTSLLVEPACNYPFAGAGPIVIVSNTCTGGDGHALHRGGMILHADVDVFMEHLVQQLGLVFPNNSMYLQELAARVQARDMAALRDIPTRIAVESIDTWTKEGLNSLLREHLPELSHPRNVETMSVTDSEETRRTVGRPPWNTDVSDMHFPIRLSVTVKPEAADNLCGFCQL